MLSGERRGVLNRFVGEDFRWEGGGVELGLCFVPLMKIVDKGPIIFSIGSVVWGVTKLWFKGEWGVFVVIG